MLVTTNLLDRVAVTPPSPRPGESFIVEALDSRGKVISNTSSTDVSIGGAPGGSRTMQYRAQGAYRLPVLVRHKHGVDTQVVTIKVTGKPVTITVNRAGKIVSEPAELHVTQSPHNPYEVTFSLGRQPRRRGDPAPAPKPHNDQARQERQAHGRTGGGRLVEFGLVDDLDPQSLPTGFNWDFGDGKTQKTPSPTVTHDFTASVDPDSTALSFEVSCTAITNGVTATRTLTLVSAYGLAKQLGTIVPIVKADPFVTPVPTGFVAQLTVTNIEAEPLTLTHRAIGQIGSSASLELIRHRRMDKPLTLAANSDVAIGAHLPLSGRLTAGTTGVEVRYGGRTRSGKKVSVSAVFDIPPAHIPPSDPDGPEPSTPTEDPARLFAWQSGRQLVDEATRTQVGSGRLNADLFETDGHILVTAKRNALTEDAALRSAGRAATDALITLAKEATLPDGIMAVDGRPPVDLIVQGGVCRPETLSDSELAIADADDLVCRITTQVDEVEMPGRFMNARKGDIILSPGGPSVVGKLLSSVSPPQFYSHCGIMTKNFEEITHSTADEGRLQRYPESPFAGETTDGLRPDVLKYLWPGVITQTAEAAINGEEYIDPEDGQTASISSFSPYTVANSHNDDFVVVPPMVVKPDPRLETRTIRETLHRIADRAAAVAGNADRPSQSHYRLSHYTDPTNNEVGPVGTGWAEGTFPSVCSSLIWMMALDEGVSLESGRPIVDTTDLELSDVERGAEVAEPLATPEGLYWYTQAERLAGAEFLYDHYYNFVKSEARKKFPGRFVAWLSDAADDLASQVVNTFATDNPDKDSDEWEDTGPANAVSPSDIMNWDGPDNGGVYGYIEPLVYREPRTELYATSRWVHVPTRRTVTGRVTVEGRPIHGAVVSISTNRDHTGADGTYVIPRVGFGTDRLQGSAFVDGYRYVGERLITVTDADETFDLELTPVNNPNRLVHLVVDFFGVDDEDDELRISRSDEVFDPPPETFDPIALDPSRPRFHEHFEYRWGGELRMEYDINLILVAEGSIDVTVSGIMYEGWRESTSNLGGRGQEVFRVDPGQEEVVPLSITNTEDNDPDLGRLRVAVRNEDRP